MSVSKQHMQWAADYVAGLPSDEWQQDHEALIRAFSAFFKAFSPRFDEERFKKAAMDVMHPEAKC